MKINKRRHNSRKFHIRRQLINETFLAIFHWLWLLLFLLKNLRGWVVPSHLRPMGLQIVANVGRPKLHARAHNINGSHLYRNMCMMWEEDSTIEGKWQLTTSIWRENSLVEKYWLKIFVKIERFISISPSTTFIWQENLWKFFSWNMHWYWVIYFC